ncbi:MAG: cellulase family glycosylhydrolase [Bacteroidales bacterium]|nr:cellulase family glycosylhydrolase [Bacteroidales bacterium]
MKRIATLLFTISVFCSGLCAQRISIQGNSFVCNGEKIFFVGTNTPWDNWNDFGGNFNPQFWADEFAKLEKNGINSSRIWISCDAEGQPLVDVEGVTHPATQQFWDNLDYLMNLATKHKIYVIATISSFDNLDETKPASKNWMALLNCTQKLQQYCDTFLKPLVERYKDNPYFFAIDICNEPEWMHEHKKYGKMEWDFMQMFVGMCAAAIHSYNTQVFVTVGSASVKWSCDKFEGNKWSDAILQDMTMNPLAYLDFWQIHYYEWTNQFGNPFHETPEHWGLDDKPCIIGETPANNKIYGFPITYDEIYSFPYSLGYDGVYPWTSNGAGTGDFGTLKNFGDAAKRMSQQVNNSKSKK